MTRRLHLLFVCCLTHAQILHIKSQQKLSSIYFDQTGQMAAHFVRLLTLVSEASIYSNEELVDCTLREKKLIQY